MLFVSTACARLDALASTEQGAVAAPAVVEQLPLQAAVNAEQLRELESKLAACAAPVASNLEYGSAYWD
jgi:hypothetical protein